MLNALIVQSACLYSHIECQNVDMAVLHYTELLMRY